MYKNFDLFLGIVSLLSAIIIYAQQTESKLLLDVLTQQRLTNYSNKPKRSLGNL